MTLYDRFYRSLNGGDESVVAIGVVTPVVATPPETQVSKPGSIRQKQKKVSFGDPAYRRAMDAIANFRQLDYEKPGYGLGRKKGDGHA